jgi:16S rRNA (uracil1498-N3)-methyltransferase
VVGDRAASEAVIRVRIANLRAGDVILDGDEHHYLARVRRAAVGDDIVAFDGAGRQAWGRIVAMSADRATLALGDVVDVPPAPPFVTAIVPLIKGDRLDLCVEKLVEVGVDRVLLYRAERAVVKLDDERAATRIARLTAVAEAAARQAGRASAPPIAGVASLAENLATVADHECKYVAVPGGDSAILGGKRIAIVTGPEGGFTPAELDATTAAGFAPIGLGPYILRAETAPVIAVALVKA